MTTLVPNLSDKIHQYNFVQAEKSQHVGTAGSVKERTEQFPLPPEQLPRPPVAALTKQQHPEGKICLLLNLYKAVSYDGHFYTFCSEFSAGKSFLASCILMYLIHLLILIKVVFHCEDASRESSFL